MYALLSGLRFTLVGIIKPSLLLLLLLLALPTAGLPQKQAPGQDQKALRQLEEELTALKQGVYKTKAELKNLEEAVLRGKITKSKAFIEFQNQAEGFFQLVSAEFYLDGEVVHKLAVEGRKTPLKKTVVFDQSLPPGQHTLQTKLVYRGSDKSIYSAFAYFKDHQFDLESNRKFGVDYGKTTVVTLQVLDKGYFKKHVKERLHLDYQVVEDWGSEPSK